MQLLKRQPRGAPSLSPKCGLQQGSANTRACYCRSYACACPQQRRLSVTPKRRGRRQPAAGAAKKKSFRRFTIFMSFARLGSYVSSFQQHGWEASVAGVFNCNMPPPTREMPAAGAAPKCFCSTRVSLHRNPRRSLLLGCLYLC